MKNTLGYLLLLTTLLSFNGCSKSGDTAQIQPPVVTPPTTALQLTMTDTSRNGITGATIALYDNPTDWGNKKNPVATGITDANGIVKFDSLSAITYYWYASQDCRNNSSGTYTTNNPLTPDTTTAVSTILYEKGKIQFNNNNTADTYDIYVNGLLILSGHGGATTGIGNMPIGFYTVRVLQTSGYAVSPTDQTFTGTITCGSTLTITFP